MLTDGSAVSIGLVVVLGGAVAAFWFRVTGMVDQERQWREDGDRQNREDMEKFADESRADRRKISGDDQNRYAIVYRELGDFRTKVAETYVSKQALNETEERLAASLEKVSARLELIVTRLEQMVVAMARAGMGPPAS